MIGWMITEKTKSWDFWSSSTLLYSAAAVKVMSEMSIQSVTYIRVVFLNIVFLFVGVVTREMFNTMQNADIIGHLTKEFNEAREITL